MSGKLSVVVGGQFGSEAKGHVTAQLAIRALADGDVVHAVRVAGPNAGHSVIGWSASQQGVDGGICELVQEGEDGPSKWKWKLRTVPVAAVINPHAWLYIAAGSEIDLDVLNAEVDALDAAGYNVTGRLSIDRSATMLEAHHIVREQQEGLNAKLGSTAKGIGAARADRIMRQARTWGEVEMDVRPKVGAQDTAGMLYDALETGAEVHIEGTQGYGLGLHGEHYPQCTSSDCRAIDFLAMAGLSPWSSVVSEFEVWVTLRTRPIRVAGNSGALAGETTWADLGLAEEITTVTRKVRRVGEWDARLARQAIEANGGPSEQVKVALTMVDQVMPEIAGRSGRLKREWGTPDGWEPEEWKQLAKYIGEIEYDLGCPVSWVGTGPDTMIELVP